MSQNTVKWNEVQVLIGNIQKKVVISSYSNKCQSPLTLASFCVSTNELPLKGLWHYDLIMIYPNNAKNDLVVIVIIIVVIVVLW